MHKIRIQLQPSCYLISGQSSFQTLADFALLISLFVQKKWSYISPIFLGTLQVQVVLQATA
jgi:hypothetical protein